MKNPAEDGIKAAKRDAMDWDYPEPTFRTAKTTEWLKSATGAKIEMRLCETYEEGRWEPFYTVVR